VLGNCIPLRIAHNRCIDFLRRRGAQDQAETASLLGWRPDFLSKFQSAMRPHEIVVAAKQLELIFETFLPPGLTDRSATYRPSPVGS
jgi:DNA-directed RNA polymerase specialized sigma24 family protein